MGISSQSLGAQPRTGPRAARLQPSWTPPLCSACSTGVLSQTGARQRACVTSMCLASSSDAPPLPTHSFLLFSHGSIDLPHAHASSEGDLVAVLVLPGCRITPHSTKTTQKQAL